MSGPSYKSASSVREDTARHESPLPVLLSYTHVLSWSPRSSYFCTVDLFSWGKILKSGSRNKVHHFLLVIYKKCIVSLPHLIKSLAPLASSTSRTRWLTWWGGQGSSLREVRSSVYHTLLRPRVLYSSTYHYNLARWYLGMSK